MTCLEIEKAFNNVKPDVINRAMCSLGLDINSRKFVDNLLIERCLSAKLVSTNLRKFVNRGTPKRVALIPLLWNLRR